LAYVGLPSLLFVLAANQTRVAECLAERGVAVKLGGASAISVERLAAEVVGLARSAERRTEMAARGRALVDGRGAARVLRLLLAGDLRLRPVAEADCRLIWEWANDPETRALSFSQAAIPWERHLEWFRSRLQDPNTIFFVVTEGPSTPVGQVRFDLAGDEAVISVGLDRRFRGKGHGSTIIRLAAEELFDARGTAVIHAYIKPNNEASRRAFAKAGFAETATTAVQGQPAAHMVLRGGGR
jgi:RimJ/RimL family protein N-acetyltransferase